MNKIQTHATSKLGQLWNAAVQFLAGGVTLNGTHQGTSVNAQTLNQDRGMLPFRMKAIIHKNVADGSRLPLDLEHMWFIHISQKSSTTDDDF